MKLLLQGLAVLSFGCAAVNGEYLYKTKHRGGCTVGTTSETGHSFESAQDRCDALGSSCVWFIQNQADGSTYFCPGEVENFDVAETADTNGNVWETWIVAKQASAPALPSVGFVSKVARGGCPNDVAIEGGPYTEDQTQAMCEQLGDQCAFYTWSNDAADGTQGHAWFCAQDNYDTADDSGSWPDWKVGRTQARQDLADALAASTKLSVSDMVFGNGDLSHSSGNCGADNCNDGNKVYSDSCGDGSSMCHSTGGNNLLRVTLANQATHVTSVVITNRLSCCQERLGHYELWVGNNGIEFNGEGNSKCYENFESTSGKITLQNSCLGFGRYVWLHLNGDNRIINLQEIEVYGDLTAWDSQTADGTNCDGRQYEGNIYLDNCLKTCVDDPNCGGIGGALDAGDGSCWHCPIDYTVSSGQHTNYKTFRYNYHTASPTRSPTGSPTGSPTTAEALALENLVASMSMSPWRSKQVGDTVYICSDLCFKSTAADRSQWTPVAQSDADYPADGLEVNTSFDVSDGQFTMNEAGVTFTADDGANASVFPWDCACA